MVNKRSTWAFWILPALTLVLAPFVHVAIYAVSCANMFFLLAYLGHNPMLEPWATFTMSISSTVAAFLVSLVAFCLVPWKWWITSLIVLLGFNFQRQFQYSIALPEALAVLTALFLIRRPRKLHATSERMCAT